MSISLPCGKNVSMVSLDDEVCGPGMISGGAGFVWAKSHQTTLRTCILNIKVFKILYIVEMVASISYEDLEHSKGMDHDISLK